MKKIVSMLIAGLISVCMTVSASAETISFPMTINTGIIYLENKTSVNTNFIPEIQADDSITIKTNSEIAVITKVALVVEGERYSRPYVDKAEYCFTNFADANCTDAVNFGGAYWKLGLFDNRARANEFLVSSFSKIYNLTIITEGYVETDDEKIYYSFGTSTKSLATNSIFTIVDDFVYFNELTDNITDLINCVNGLNYANKEVICDYPFLMNTDENNDGNISRTEVYRLSYSELGEGKGMVGFEGLASQVSEFFNRKTNGKITFKITTEPALISTTWNSGGIPAYYNGVLAQKTTIPNDIIALFFSYESTGSLVVTSKIDDGGYVTFDISDILKMVDGNTIASFKSIYYALIGGTVYDGYLCKGLKIEKVILSYEDETDITIPIEIHDEPDTDIDIIDEPVEEITKAPVPDTVITEPVIEEVSEPVISISEDTTQVAVINDIIVDENPHTGAGLAVIPTIISGVVLISVRRRRK